MGIRSYAKISLPNFSRTFDRERIFEILDEYRGQLATFICAPPGFGKTTLISSYIKSKNLQRIWYQIDEGDDDLASFFYYLGLAIKSVSKNKNFQPPKLTPEYSFGINTFSRRYFREIYSQFSDPFVLVFDNFQEVAESSLLIDLLSNICMEIPEHGHIYFISRQYPPSSFARLLTHKEMFFLGLNTLRFNNDEIKEFLCLQGAQDLTEEELNRIAIQSEGWVAGLLHLHDRKEALPDKLSLGNEPGKILYDYFSWEVFDNFDLEKQKVLLMSAFMPQMSVDSLEQLTGKPDASQILRKMCEENYFTVQQGERKVVYQYHPMFREFLIKSSNEYFSDKKIKSIKSKSAEILLKAGEIGDAISLLSELEDWALITQIIIQNAPEYMSQGRFKTITQWISVIPEEVVKHTAWLLYWSGISQLWVNPVDSQHAIEKAYKLFKENGDVIGLWLSWSGVVECIFIAFREISLFDIWVRELDDILQLPQINLPPDIAVRVAASMLSILAFRQPQNTKLKDIADDLLLKNKSFADQGLVLMAHSYLVTYYTWGGRFSDAELALLPFKKFDDQKVYPMVSVLGLLSEAALQLNCGDASSCLKTALNGIKIAEETGVHIWDVTLFQFVAQASIQIGDFKTAEKFSQQALRVIDDNRNNSSGFQHSIFSWQALLQKDIPLAKKHSVKSIDLAELGGVPYFKILCYITYAHVLAEEKNFVEAEVQIKKALSIGEEIQNNMAIFMCLLLSAYTLILQSRTTEAIEYLQKALMIGRENNYKGTFDWRPDVMSRLCQMALINEIEIEYVKLLIRENRLQPEYNCSMAAKHWPCDLRIYTLGRFSIEKQGELIQFTGKAQRKPMELLKGIIALGGRGVSEKNLSDVLWPDAEGDAAQQALSTTVFRLRKLIGEHIITRQEKKISIDAYSCWVDCWELERHLNSKNQNSIEIATRIMELYQSQFLVTEEAHYLLPVREKLHRKLVKTISSHAQKICKAGDYDQAEELYNWGLGVDDLIEDFYTGLMATYIAQDRKGDAISVYNHCKKIFLSQLGIEPSAKSKQLYQSILAS
jgi:LuxR family transcriptional regulator, maltose regulon positive regulatory protein